MKQKNRQKEIIVKKKGKKWIEMKNSDSFEKTAVIWEIIVIFLFEKLERKEKVVL